MIVDEDELEVGEGLDRAGLGDLVGLDHAGSARATPKAQSVSIQNQSKPPWIGVQKNGPTSGDRHRAGDAGVEEAGLGAVGAGDEAGQERVEREEQRAGEAAPAPAG